MADLIVEFRSEEIPARMQRRAREDLAALFQDVFSRLGLKISAEHTFVTPKRLTYAAEGVPLATPDCVEEKRGPRVDAPQQAIDGFLRQTGLTSLDQCERRDTGKGEFYFAVLQQKGQDVATLLPEIVDEIITRFPWPKSMRWGKGNRSWVRPLSAGLCVFDGRPVLFELSMNKELTDAPRIAFTGETVGHRFMNPESFVVTDLTGYRDHLMKNHVMVDQDVRLANIKAQVASKASEKGLAVWNDPGLDEEVTGLVEWPVAYLGAIDPRFLELPREVLITVMRVHQRYFALQDREGHLAPHFVVVANIDAKDGGATLVDGNERVLKARFSDAQFFYTQDLKMPLSTHAQGLANIVFHKDLGLMSSKVERLKRLSRWLAPYFQVSPDQAEHAALLAKADLTTQMVGEFPELQGIMGRVYSLAQGEAPEVAAAIEEHYLPRGAGDDLPASDLGRVLALADRLDTLVGFFALQIRPTGSRDPFALRRAALSLIRLLADQGEVRLKNAFSAAYEGYEGAFAHHKDGLSQEETLASLHEFMLDRLKVYCRDQGIRHDIIAAAFAVAGDDPLHVLFARVRALAAFMQDEKGEGRNLLAGARRASNIVRIEEAKDKISFNDLPDAALLEHASEKALFQALEAHSSVIEAALQNRDFAQAMALLAELRQPIDTFFTNVVVNAPEAALRVNRLRLLTMIRKTLCHIADFSKIEDISHG